MKCSSEFRKRVAEQAELARRGSGRGYTGQMTFTYGEVKWILADLAALAGIEQAEREIPGRQNVVIGAPEPEEMLDQLRAL
jgi:hypothetical protein